MNRRGFLGMLVGGVAVAAAAQSFPFRVFSFPTNPLVVPTFEPHLAGWWSYRYTMTVTLPPNASGRIRYIDCVPAITEPVLRPYRTYIIGQEGLIV